MALHPDISVLFIQDNRAIRLIRCGRDALEHMKKNFPEGIPPPSHTTFPNFGGVPVLEGGELKPHEVELIDGAGRIERWFITDHGLMKLRAGIL